MARLAITKDVLSAFAKLDKRVQGAVEAAIAGFANGHAEAHLEKVPGSLDDRIRLLRVDGSWYGVVLVPDSGDTYCLLTILPMDEAVGYATSHRVSVNQATGVLEVSNSAAIQEMQPSLQTAADPNVIRLFADVSDADLTRLGIDAHDPAAGTAPGQRRGPGRAPAGAARSPVHRAARAGQRDDGR